MSKIHVKFEHDLAEFNYHVKVVKRTLIKFHRRRLWLKITGRGR
jgi:hypothetical protein